MPPSTTAGNDDVAVLLSWSQPPRRWRTIARSSGETPRVAVAGELAARDGMAGAGKRIGDEPEARSVHRGCTRGQAPAADELAAVRLARPALLLPVPSALYARGLIPHLLSACYSPLCFQLNFLTSVRSLHPFVAWLTAQGLSGTIKAAAATDCRPAPFETAFQAMACSCYAMQHAVEKLEAQVPPAGDMQARRQRDHCGGRYRAPGRTSTADLGCP
jgi:hypothetical protein